MLRVKARGTGVQLPSPPPLEARLHNSRAFALRTTKRPTVSVDYKILDQTPSVWPTDFRGGFITKKQ
jgi:hypothetical protein